MRVTSNYEPDFWTNAPKFSQWALSLRFELYLWGSSLEIYPSGTGLELYLWGSCLKPYPWGAPLELYPWWYPWGSSLELYSWGSRLELYLWGSSLELYSWGSRLELYPWGSSLDYTPEAPVWSLSSLSELSERTFWHLVKSSQYTFFTSFVSSWKSLVGLFSNSFEPSEIFLNLLKSSQTFAQPLKTFLNTVLKFLWNQLLFGPLRIPLDLPREPSSTLLHLLITPGGPSCKLLWALVNLLKSP